MAEYKAKTGNDIPIEEAASDHDELPQLAALDSVVGAVESSLEDSDDDSDDDDDDDELKAPTPPPPPPPKKAKGNKKKTPVAQAQAQDHALLLDPSKPASPSPSAQLTAPRTTTEIPVTMGKKRKDNKADAAEGPKKKKSKKSEPVQTPVPALFSAPEPAPVVSATPLLEPDKKRKKKARKSEVA